MQTLKRVSSLLTIGALLLIWGMAVWALNLKDYEAPEMMIFLGRFHPLVLHMPIGFMVLALLLDFGRLLPGKLKESLPKTTWLHALIVASTTLTVVHGILLYAGGGYEGSELAERHLVGGCVFLTVIGVIFLLNLWLDHKPVMNVLGLPLALIAMALLSISAHDGASLTHGENYLSQYAPEPLKPLLEPGYVAPVVVPEEEKVPLADQNIYAVAVQPLFDRTCVECHKESKKKGKLRMDTYEEIMKGGSSGAMFVANDVENSLFLERIHLPMDDDEHMPPEGKKQPTAEEVAVLTWWVSAGAPAEGTLASHNPPADILNALNVIHGGEEEVVEEVIAEVPKISREELAVKVDAFNDANVGTVNFLSLEDDLLTFSAFSEPTKVDNTVLKELMPLGEYLAEINLNRTKVTTSGVAKLLQVTPNLTRLSLNDCNVSDKIVDFLTPLEKLEALSLYGTKITDKTLMSLVQMENIERIYASNTEATSAGANRALKSVQKLEVVINDAPVPAAPPAAKPNPPKLAKEKPAPKPAPKAQPKPAPKTAPAPTSSVNLAKGKPAFASEQYSPQFPATAITDGIKDEVEKAGKFGYWLLPNKVQGHIQIDLQKPESISRIVIQNCKNRQFNDRATKDFRLELSVDGQKFTQVAKGALKKISTNIPNAPHPAETFTFNPTNGRYVRVYIDSVWGNGGGLNEVEVYAK